jgi:hypothetical protein
MGTGKRVVYAATGQEADRTFAGGLLGYVEHYQNGDHLRKLSRDTMRGTSSRARRGLWPGGPIPFGYDRLILDGDEPRRIVRDLEDGGQLVLNAADGSEIERLLKGKRHGKQDHETVKLIPSDPSRVRVVQRMFADYAAGKPTRVLRDQINAAGFRTARGSAFTVQTILPILENPAYAGRCVYNRITRSKWHRYRDGNSIERHDEGIEDRPANDWITCDNAWPALVEPEIFEQVQQRRKAARKRNTHRRGSAMRSEYLLSGLFFCGVCGGKMTGQTHTNKKRVRTPYYVCSRYSAGHKHECPKRFTVPAKLVENHIIELIRRDLAKLRGDKRLECYVMEELQRLTGGRDDARDQLKRQLATLDQRIAKTRDHLLTMDPETAKSLGLYDQASTLTAERRTSQIKHDRTPPLGP